MFKNRYLKQLKDVQVRIKNCKAAIAALDPPEPLSIKVGRNVRAFIDALTYRLHPDLQKVFGTFEDETYDYLHQLGEYFINIADYEKKKKQYNQELGQLQIEEGCLKRKLGID